MTYEKYLKSLKDRGLSDPMSEAEFNKAFKANEEKKDFLARNVKKNVHPTFSEFLKEEK